MYPTVEQDELDTNINLMSEAQIREAMNKLIDHFAITAKEGPALPLAWRNYN